jgi:hypothetical protein
MDDKIFLIKKKDTKTAPNGACFNFKVNLGSAVGAFSYSNDKLDEEKFKNYKAMTRKDEEVYFLGILTGQEDERMYIINCKCVMDKFRKRKNWDEEWVSGDNLHTCTKERCSSVCCDSCFINESVKLLKGSYKCPFPCKTGMMYCKFNDPKKREQRYKKISSDRKSCANCGITQSDFIKNKPNCKPMVWTPVPNSSSEFWCNKCRVSIKGLGRNSITNQKRKLEYKKKYENMAEDAYQQEMKKILEEEEKKKTEVKPKKPRQKSEKKDGDKKERKKNSSSKTNGTASRKRKNYNKDQRVDEIENLIEEIDNRQKEEEKEGTDSGSESSSQDEKSDEESDKNNSDANEDEKEEDDDKRKHKKQKRDHDKSDSEDE